MTDNLEGHCVGKCLMRKHNLASCGMSPPRICGDVFGLMNSLHVAMRRVEST